MEKSKSWVQVQAICPYCSLINEIDEDCFKNVEQFLEYDCDFCGTFFLVKSPK